MMDIIRSFIAKWSSSGAAERANKDAFLIELCAILDVPPPDPATGDPARDLYVFERDALLPHEGGRVSVILLEMEGATVTPEQFRGIEVKRWAKEIAELVLWIGYLQWQVRTRGTAQTVPEPVLQDYGNIEHRDAVLAWDRTELVCDDKGAPVTRWDGITTKASPVTGEEIPDETARVPVYRYINPRKAEWPEADFIVGNPPFIGNWCPNRRTS